MRPFRIFLTRSCYIGLSGFLVFLFHLDERVEYIEESHRFYFRREVST